MNTSSENIKLNTSGKPQVFFKSIIFNDGTRIDLSRDSIVIFTGSNNSGKSQVLKDAEERLDASNHSNGIVIKEAELEFCGSIDEESFFSKNFTLNENGYYMLSKYSALLTLNSLRRDWKNQTLTDGVHILFVKRLSSELRLTSSNALGRSESSKSSPIYKIFQSEALAQKISDYFHQAFGIDLVVNRGEIETIPLHVGNAPDANKYTIANQDEYYDKVSKLPKLQEQGDGMRSFATILLDTFTSDNSITLIDEPEAFLHPPQARVLGKMLAKNNPANRQLILSTHSEDFLQGLLDADYQNVTVIRINRSDDINNMSILRNDEIKKLWSNSILRYSNMLSGLFHEKVVVCESDYDCLFYQAILNAIYEHKGELAGDILFTHCGGKGRVRDVVSALKAVNVPVVAVCDFDLINSSQIFRPIVDSFGLNWQYLLSEGMKTIYDDMNAKSSSGNDAWEQIKKVSKQQLSGPAYPAYEKVEQICKAAGLFIVPVGEMECFDKSITKDKKDWVYHVLENYDLATEPKLEEARKFVQEIVEF